jgi:glc operon protein GlcG
MNRSTLFHLAFALAIAVSSTFAQVGTKKVLTLEGAKKVATAIEDEARRLGVGGAIAVVDDGGHVMYLVRIDDTFVAGAEISIGKARTAATFKRATNVFENIINKGRTAMVAVDFTPLQGGVPITVDGQVIGAVGVSGASSARQDEELAVVGANVLNTEPVNVIGSR